MHRRSESSPKDDVVHLRSRLNVIMENQKISQLLTSSIIENTFLSKLLRLESKSTVSLDTNRVPCTERRHLRHSPRTPYVTLWFLKLTAEENSSILSCKRELSFNKFGLNTIMRILLMIKREQWGFSRIWHFLIKKISLLL